MKWGKLMRFLLRWVFRIAKNRSRLILIQLSASKIRALLNEFNWDAEELLESILEGGERINKLMSNAWEFSPCDVRKSFECQICVDEVSPQLIRKLECNHRFCVDCLLGYLTVALKESGLITNAINCPGFKCKYELEDEFVLKLLEEDQQRKYLQIIVDSFIQVRRWSWKHRECNERLSELKKCNF